MVVSGQLQAQANKPNVMAAVCIKCMLISQNMYSKFFGKMTKY